MRHMLTAIAALALFGAVSPSAKAHPRHRSHHRSVAAAASQAHRAQAPSRYGDTSRTPVDARYGYSENPEDRAYTGPGAQIFAIQKQQERNARVLHEVAPDAKISATGVVVGGY